MWNGNDPIIKERLFGLTNSEGNHGEDVKEYYYYLDSTPTHSFMRYLYKYPQAAYPYDNLVEMNRGRSKTEPEYELIDTGVFDDDRYFDVFVEYAKTTPEDILIRILVANRGDARATLHLLPTLLHGRPNPEAGRLDDEAARGWRGGRARRGGPTHARRKLYTPARVEVVERLESEDMLPAVYFIFSRNQCDQGIEDGQRHQGTLAVVRIC